MAYDTEMRRTVQNDKFQQQMNEHIIWLFLYPTSRR